MIDLTTEMYRQIIVGALYFVAEILPVVLAVAIGFMAIFQPTRERLEAAGYYAGLGIAHMVFFYFWLLYAGERMDGITYFVTAVAASYLAMELMTRVERVVGVIISLHRVCLAEIGLNMLGLYLWYNELTPSFNVYAFIILRIYVISVLLRKDHADDMGGYTISGRRDYLLTVFGARRLDSNKRGTQA